MKDYKVWYAPKGFDAYGNEEIEAVTDCLKDGWLGGDGPKTLAFEREIAQLFGKKSGLAVNSGSSANLLALSCLKLPAESQVITPACTFSTTVAPIIQCGLTPVFCDVDQTTFVADVDEVLKLVSDEVKVIMLPNLIGNSPDWSALRRGLTRMGRGDITLIEDSADTIVSGRDSDITTTSFYPSHVITAGGLGGMVMFNDEALQKRARQFRDWGRKSGKGDLIIDRFSSDVDGIAYDDKYLYTEVGYNMKLSEMNAAFGLAQLNRIDEFLQKRRQNFERYVQNLHDLGEIQLPNDAAKPNWLALPFLTEKRLELVTHLEESGIQTRLIFAGNITRHPAYREYLQEFPNADRIMKNGLMVGLHQGVTLDDVDFVCEQIRAFFGK